MTIGDQGAGGVQDGACHGCGVEGLLLVCRCGDVVLDKEADVEVNQEGDKDVANVVNEFSHVRTVSRSIW